MARASQPMTREGRLPSFVVLLLLILVVSVWEGTNLSKGTIAAYNDALAKLSGRHVGRPLTLSEIIK